MSAFWRVSLKESRLLATCMTAAGLMLGCTNAARRDATSQPTTQRVPRSSNTPGPVHARPIDQAIREGVAFIVTSQNADGSWGTGLQTRGLEIMSMVPGSHDAYRVGTTALCVMALREAGERTAHAKGVRYLIEHGEARRDDGSLLYNTWAHIYALQAIAEELKVTPSDVALKKAAARQVEELQRYETYLGGWNYYDFDAHTAQPSLAATSFQTAAGIVAMVEAQAAGVLIPPGMMDRAIRRVAECRAPDGSYLYGSDYQYLRTLPANKPNGSIGRMQSNNYALWLVNSPRVGREQTVEGLKTFFTNHQWIAMGRKRPWPHEAWYQTSGYYYYFAHYYAARIIERLDGDARKQAAAELEKYVLPFQEADGSWWDYAMWDYHKPYGTAYAVMTLLRCREAGLAAAEAKPRAATTRATTGSLRGSIRGR